MKSSSRRYVHEPLTKSFSAFDFHDFYYEETEKWVKSGLFKMLIVFELQSHSDGKINHKILWSFPLQMMID